MDDELLLITNIRKSDEYLVPLCAEAAGLEHYVIDEAHNIYGTPLKNHVGVYIPKSYVDDKFIQRKTDSRFVACMFLAGEMIEDERGKRNV